MKLHETLPQRITSARYVEADAAPFKGVAPGSKGSRRQGLLYERRVISFLADSLGHPNSENRWLAYTKGKSDKTYYCQPDAIIHADSRTYVIEVKLTIRPRLAKQKLQLLYGPLVQMLHPDQEIILLQVCKNLRRGPLPKELVRWQDLDVLKGGEYAILHIPNP